ncbi:MAG: hypothetical protein M1546_08495, partial [Chloroflexi bacterium]|nr:hypothetical protein [Chloroflexota bacterium]
HLRRSCSRIIDSARLDPTSLATNLVLWLRTPFISGDQRLEFNLPGRPLFDIANGVLWGVGLLVSTLAARRIYRRGWYAPLVFILAVSTVLPSLISNDAPNIVRAIGIFVPSAVFAGAGATWIETTAQRRGSHTVFRAAQAGLAGMVAISGVTTVGDMQRWIAHPGQYYSRHQQTHEAADYFKANLSPDTPVYFNPEELNFEGMYDAVIRFRAADLRPRHVGAADTRKCFPLPDVPAGYTAFETPSLNAHFQEVLQPWAQTRQLYQSVYVADSVTTYTQTLYLVTPLLDRLHPDDEPSIRLGNDSGDLFELRPTGLPEAVRAGDSITVTARFRMLRPASYDYRITLSLLNDPEDSAGRNHWAEQDDFICSIYGSTKWQANETIIRTLSLQVPADAPSGRYALVLRTYGGEPYKSVEDLHVTAPTYDDKYEGRYYHPLNVTGTRTSLNDDVTALELTAVDGYIREWWLIGGFPGNALDDDVLTGGEADYRVPDDGQGAVLIRSRSSKIDLTRFVRPVEQNVAYLFAWIKSPDDRKGFLGMNSDDSIAAWLNGEEVWRNKVSRYMPDDMRDIDLPPIELKKGWNALLIKVDQNTGEWAFKARVLNPDGSVMHDVEVATRRQ